jgi:hypothetical protein
MIFDLKGSTVGRKEYIETKFWSQSLDQKKTMKDMNFLEISQEVSLVKLQPGEKELLEKVIELDSKFLASHNLMDYSLLLVIE